MIACSLLLVWVFEAQLLSALAQSDPLRFPSLSPAGTLLAGIDAESRLRLQSWSGVSSFRELPAAHPLGLGFLGDQRLLLSAAERADAAAGWWTFDLAEQRWQLLWPPSSEPGLAPSWVGMDGDEHLWAGLPLNAAHQRELCRIALRDGSRVCPEGPVQGRLEWQASADGVVRVARAWRLRKDEPSYGLWWRNTPAERWRLLHEHRLGESHWLPLLARRSELLVQINQPHGESSLHWLDPLQAVPGPALISHADHELGALVLNAESDMPDVVEIDGALPRHLHIETRLQKDLAALQGRWPGQHLRVLGTSPGHLLVRRFADNDPGALHWLERYPSTGQKLMSDSVLATQFAWASTALKSVQTRDGSRIDAYWTRAGAPTTAPVPAVLLIHGGPWAQDRWGFDPLVQALAMRGFGVLQVNFRGSSGRGPGFLNAGRKAWRGHMQTDLLDAIEALADAGELDRTRVCAAGISYGGLAASLLALDHPHRLRCAVAINAPADLQRHIERLHERGHLLAFHEWRTLVGDPQRDQDLLHALSPARRLGELHLPLLVVQSHADLLLGARQRELWRAAIDRHPQQSLRWLELPQSGHDIGSVADRHELLRQVRGFLAEFLH